MLNLLAIREISAETSKIALKLQIGFEVDKRVWGAQLGSPGYLNPLRGVLWCLSISEKALEMSRNIQETVSSESGKTVNLAKTVTNSKLSMFSIVMSW
jgi:hypothetical protein